MIATQYPTKVTIMHFNQGIILLTQFHNARLVAHYATESGIQGQLSTGLADSPFIPVNDSQVCADDVFSILEIWDSLTDKWEPQDSFHSALNNLPTPESCWGLEPSFV